MSPPSNSFSRPLTFAMGAVILLACSSGKPTDGPASTTPSQAVASPTTSDTPAVAATSAAPASAPESTMIKTPTYQGVVLAVKSASDAGLGSGPPYDGVWLPSAADVAAFESGLAAYMTKTVPAEKKTLVAKLKSYKRQWFGIAAGDKKLIYGNFFCGEEPGWEKHTVMVDDGGDCYFQLFYDVASGEYRNLMINGDA